MNMAKFEFFSVLLCFFILFVSEMIESRRHAPLLDNEFHMGKHRNAECTFGKQVKEIGSSWFADLGPPFGVMYCIKCECVKVQKKRRVVARVQCRNIKNECPKPSCDEPVLLPGRCCKTCPGDFYSPDIPLDSSSVLNANDEEEKSMKHYASLLTGRSSLVVKREDSLTVPVSVNKNNVVATGRFTFHRKNLYYSFYVSDKAARPRHLQFVDNQGNILEEHELSGPGIVTSLYQNVTRKICGVWKRLPRDYRRLLKDQKLYAVLVWGVKEQLEFVLSGPIMRYVALGTELFSSLLEPAQGSDGAMMQGAGATAIVSTSSASTPSIHIAVVFNGIFMPDETQDVPINITLSLEEKQQIIIEEIKRVKKPAHELNIIEVSSPVSAVDLRLLTRGRLVLTIASVHKPDALRLTGAVVTRATCELFQTPLTTPTIDNDAKYESPSGVAWLFMNSDGALVFNIQIEETQKTVALISLVDMSSKRKTEIDDLTPFYSNGWANGTIERLGPKYLEPLYSGNVVVNVTFQNGNQQTSIRGRLTSKPVAEARDTREAILLKRVSKLAPKNGVGMAWVAVDHSCYLHYDVSLSGMSNYDKWLQLYLIDKPLEAPGAPITTKLLEEFKGNQIEDTGNVQLTREQLSHLESGVAYLEIHERDSMNVLLKGTVKQIKVPTTCLPVYNDNDVPTSHLDRPSTITEPPRSCYSEGRFYEEGTDWTMSFDPCTMCFCQNGKVKCESTTCPLQNCKLGTKTTGECCPPCLSNSTQLQDSNTSITQGCKLGKQYHSPGSRWHPFLVPNGFDRCTECRCDPHTLEVKCSRMTCILDCDERVAIRVDDKSCCKQCPNGNNESVQNNEPYKQPLIIEPPVNRDEIPPGSCKIYGGIVRNGTVFHPRIASMGEHKCTICTCKDGQPFCERLKCTKSMCNNTTYRQRRNISESTLEKCCSCKRLRRHHNHRSHGQT